MEKPEDLPALSETTHVIYQTQSVCKEESSKADEMRIGDMKSISHAGNINVVLENQSVWSRFHSVGTEMIITKQGRRMFPWCRFRLAGLDPTRMYFLLMDIVPLDDLCHRWNGETWEPEGPGEPRIQRSACVHPESPAVGQRWMDGPVSFYKVKLTYDTVDQDSFLTLHPMHHYQPHLYVVPVSACLHRPVSLEGPEVQMFTFPKTEFYAVTSFQNPKINQLKVDCNPFMLAFREDGEKKLKLAVSDRCQSQSTLSHSHDENSKHLVSTCTRDESRESSEDKERVLSDRKRFVCDQKAKEGLPGSSEAHRLTSDHSSENVSSHHRKKNTITSQQKSDALSTSHCSAAGNTRGVNCRSKHLRKSRKAKSKWWSNVKYARNAVHPRPADVSMQPDLEDVDGMLFVSFGVKQALDGHVVNMSMSVDPSSSSLTHSQTDNSQLHQEVLLRLEEIISHQELTLRQHLKKQKNRQTVHPALQNVGLKLNLVDPAVPIDLHHLGVCLSSSAVSVNNLSTSSVPFVSGTRKTDDLTNIKGWKKNSNFTSEQRSMDSSVKHSAFFSDELEEYLESEALQIHQRADVFFTSSPSPVVYQLPDKSSSYVRTLDSVLQTRSLTPAHHTPSADHHNLPNVLPFTPAVITSSGRSKPTTLETLSKRFKPKSIHTSPRAVVSKHKAEVRACGRLSLCSSIDGRWSTPAKMQMKLLVHEQEAVYHGKSHTCVTTERAKFALTSLLTSQKSKKLTFSKYPVSEDACGNDFCGLGCVCESLNRKIRGPTHCRRPQCMFGCDCFKHKVFLIRPSEKVGKKQLIAFSVGDPEFNRRPDTTPNVSSLWNRRSDDDDLELVFTPAAIPVPQKDARLRVYVPRPNPVIREMEKDPVYRYLESKMTCARVREYNSNPPPQFYIFPVKKHRSGHELSAHRHLMSSSPDKNPAASGGNIGEPEPTKVLEIISECNWEAHRSVVLKELFRSITMDLLSSPLFVNIYRVDLVSTALKKDEGHCTLNYKVCVSFSETSRQTDVPKKKENKRKISIEQIHVNNNPTGQQVCKSSDKQSSNEIHLKNVHKETAKPFPFLSRVVTAGCLKACMKTSACVRPIQVNGKTYSQAKLLLGQMGSLHPANRLAAYVTGRMKPMCQSQSQSARTPASLKNTQPLDNSRRSRITPLKVSNPVAPTDSISVPNPSSTPDYITSSNPRLVPISVPQRKQPCPSFILTPSAPDVSAKPSIVLPAAALPPDQQVVLQPVAGVSEANMCHFNSQVIKLLPLPAVLPLQLQAKGNIHQEPPKPSFQLPQMSQSSVNPQEPASSQAAFPKPFPCIVPKIISLPRVTGFSFTGDTTAQGLKNGFAGKAGTFSFRICPPADDQTEKLPEAGLLLPGGYRLMKLPCVESENTENSSSAFMPSHLINICTAKSSQDCESAKSENPVSCDLMSEMTLRNDSDLSRNSNREDQMVCCPKVDSTAKTNAMCSSHVDVTNKGLMRHESSVHIKTEPCEIPTQLPLTSNRNVPKHLMPNDAPQTFIKIEPYDSHESFSKHHKQEPSCVDTSCPVDNPANTDTVLCTHPDNAEESNNPEESFVVIKIETYDETSETNPLPDHVDISESTMNPVTNDLPSRCSKTEPPENNNLKTEETGEVFKHPISVQESCNGPRQMIRSFLKDGQHHSGDRRVEICRWPFRLMEKAMNSSETEESRNDCEASYDDEMSLSTEDSRNILNCFSDDWTSDDGNDACSEKDIDIETVEEKNVATSICQLRTQARRTLKKIEQHKLELRDESDGFQVGWTQHDAKEHQSVYKRAWRLNQSGRKRKRGNELKQSFHSLRRIINVEEKDVSVKDVLLQAHNMIESLERRSRSLTEKKKSLIQKQCSYISLILQRSGSVLQHAGLKTIAETASHNHSVTKRPLGLPQIVLRAFSNT